MIVRDVMTKDVVTVLPGQSLKEVARLLVERRISGVPVEDGTGSVLGVVSEGDLLMPGSTERAPRHGGPLAWFLDPLDVVDRLKLGARVAGEAMTSPAVTIGADRRRRSCSRADDRGGVNRLPVIDDGQARRDRHARRPRARVRPLRRGDRTARSARTSCKRTMWLEPGSVGVEVDDGDVHLTGKVERRSEAELLPVLVGRTLGVVGVDSQPDVAG